MVGTVEKAVKPVSKESASARGRRARRAGIWAERATLWLLWLRGWDLAAWRQNVGRYELDILVTKGDDLRLIEVKARKLGAWVSADIALSEEQRRRLQSALRLWLDQIPWPRKITFQRVGWSGLRCKFHPVENWEEMGIKR
jgi:Holliday junction resolvase-like predicted endonuclease